MLLCPNCTKTLKKDPKHGEGVWTCPECGGEWFILNIPTPKYLQRKKRKK
jgi:Zn-finger nucleic acid-binding protein